MILLDYLVLLFIPIHKTRKGFLRKNLVAVLFFRTGLHTVPSYKYKTLTLSKITEA